MPKASEVAAELRRVADALDKEPETLVHEVWVSFYCNSKEEFLATARLMPRPLVKTVRDPDSSYSKLAVEHKNDAMWLDCNVRREQTCVLVEPARPAKYDCIHILSDDEEAALEAQGDGQ